MDNVIGKQWGVSKGNKKDCIITMKSEVQKF